MNIDLYEGYLNYESIPEIKPCSIVYSFYIGCTQMLCTLFGGYIQMYYPLGMFEETTQRKQKPKDFRKNMMIVGSLR